MNKPKLGGVLVARAHGSADEETASIAKWQWEEHCRKYGSNNVIYPYGFNTNITVSIGAGTNGQQIEFGFREDGVVVWRKRE